VTAAAATNHFGWLDGHGAVASYLFASSVGGIDSSRGGVNLVSLAASVPFLTPVPWLSGWMAGGCAGDGRVSPAVNVAGKCHLCPNDCPYLPRVRVISDDGVRLDHRWTERESGGIVADRIGIEQALSMLAFALLVAAALAMPLPGWKTRALTARRVAGCHG